MFVVPNDFRYDPYSLPGNDLTGNNLVPFITRMEKELLKKVLGLRMYKQFVAALPPANSGAVPPIWQRLRDGAEYELDVAGKKILYEWKGLLTNEGALVPFIYAMWIRERFKNVSAIGVGASKGENEEKITPDDEIIKGYNAMAKMIGGDNCGRKGYENSLYGFLYVNSADYPDWVFTSPGTMNQWNL
jgi:hypothetical protein